MAVHGTAARTLEETRELMEEATEFHIDGMRPHGEAAGTVALRRSPQPAPQDPRRSRIKQDGGHHEPDIAANFRLPIEQAKAILS